FEGGRTDDGLCQQMDLGPTILELAEIDIPKTMEAKTLLPALQGKDWTPREYVFAEHGRDGILQETEFVSMVRSNDWKLVHFVDSPDGQLFDLKNDPDEVENLWNDPAHAPKKRELLDVFLHWRLQSDVETSDWAANWR
ncbi:MAG: DUF4976 domain-containing protein, partial [Planctomycetes bacterium]|nr:DUF4976 domain-containing protein [Planctomycetota bacterium]